MSKFLIRLNKDEITILMGEYTTLRNEIIQRNSILNQILTVGGTATVGILALLATSSKINTWIEGLYVGFPLFAILFTLIYTAHRLLDSNTRLAANRLCELELEIENLAGKPLLTWERTNGILSIKGNQPHAEHVWSPLVRCFYRAHTSPAEEVSLRVELDREAVQATPARNRSR